jgi:hypothetical protein
MEWLWASIERAERPMLRVSVPEGHVAFFNGGTEHQLWGRLYGDRPAIERQAATELVATAHAAVAAALATKSNAVAVLGDGMLAQVVRDLLPDYLRGQTAAPDLVVDTTGAVDSIRMAVAGLPRLGYLILAAPPQVADIELATYQHIHVRALTVAGVAWRFRQGAALCDRPAVESVLARLASLPTTFDSLGDAWYAAYPEGLA